MPPAVHLAACQGAGGLAGDAELAGDLGRVDASGEQLGGAQPAGLQSLALAVGLGAAGRGRYRVLPVAAAVEVRLRTYHVNPIPKTL